MGILLSTNRRFSGWASPNSNCCCFQTEASYRTKGPKLAEEPRFFNWTTLHKNFLGAPTLLLGSSSKIQKQFKMKADFFQNLKALSYSESCPPVGCLYQYIEKGKNLSLCANYRFSGDEQNTQWIQSGSNKNKAKTGKFRLLYLLNKKNYTEERREIWETFIFQDTRNKACQE